MRRAPGRRGARRAFGRCAAVGDRAIAPRMWMARPLQCAQPMRSNLLGAFWLVAAAAAAGCSGGAAGQSPGGSGPVKSHPTSKVTAQRAIEENLPMATRLVMIKADGSVSIHADDRAYKPLNWMSPPCRLEESPGVWRVVNKAGEELRITLEEIFEDISYDLGVDPGLRKDGVEAHLQELLAANPSVLGEGFTLVRREYPTAIGPVDLLCRDATGAAVAVEVKRRGEIDGVEQLTRYLELLNRDPLRRRSNRRRGCSPRTAGSGVSSSTMTRCAASSATN